MLRGDNEVIAIGRDTNVQAHCIMHTDIGFPLSIGAGCTIGENTLIGMGAIVLNGAKIGKNCLVGAGALVTEGKSFPDNSLIVGSPARLVRELDEAQIEKLKLSARHYVEKGHSFMRGMEPV